MRTFASTVIFLFAIGGGVVAQEVDASRRTAIVRATERVAPSVVSINTRSTQRVRPRTIIDFMGPGTRETQGLGSGFIMRSDGIVITNEHVVRAATTVVVTLSDGRDFEADIVGTDEVTDIAVLRIRTPPRDLPVAPLVRNDARRFPDSFGRTHAGSAELHHQ